MNTGFTEPEEHPDNLASQILSRRRPTARTYHGKAQPAQASQIVRMPWIWLTINPANWPRRHARSPKALVAELISPRRFSARDAELPLVRYRTSGCRRRDPIRPGIKILSASIMARSPMTSSTGKKLSTKSSHRLSTVARVYPIERRHSMWCTRRRIIPRSALTSTRKTFKRQSQVGGRQDRQLMISVIELGEARTRHTRS